MALAGKRTAAAGGADPQQTTASGLWGQFTSALVAAGWTEIFDYGAQSTAWATSTAYVIGDIRIANSIRWVCIQAGTSAASGTGPTLVSATDINYVSNGGNRWVYMSNNTTEDKVYSSTGESGNEKIYLRVLQTPATYWGFVGTPGIVTQLFQYFDMSRKRGFNPLTHDNYDFVAGNAHDYAMVASLDGYYVQIRNAVNGTATNFTGGNLIRHPSINSAFFTSNNAVTAGTNKTFTFSSGNPVSSGYKVGDPVTIVSQQGTDNAYYIVPVYAALITAVTSNSITIDKAQEATEAGAFVGQDPMPYFRIIHTANSPDSGLNFRFATAWSRDNDGSGPTCLYNLDVNGHADNGYTGYSTGRGIVKAGTGNIGVNVDPNKRSDRFFLTQFCTGPDGEIRGSVPHLYLNPRATDALWSIARTNKQSTNYDYVTIPFLTNRNLIGPFVITGSANYTAEIIPVDTEIYVEGEVVPPEAGPTSDRAIQTTGNDLVWPYRANVGPDESSGGTSGTGNDSGFNGGFN